MRRHRTLGILLVELDAHTCFPVGIHVMRHFVAVVVESVEAAFLAIDVEHAVVSFAFVRRYLSGIIGHTVPVVIGHAAVPIHEVAAKEVSAGHPIGIRM